MEWYYIVWNILGFVTCSLGVWLWWTEDKVMPKEFRDSFILTVIIFALFGYLIPIFTIIAVVASPFLAVGWLTHKLRDEFS